MAFIKAIYLKMYFSPRNLLDSEKILSHLAISYPTISSQEHISSSVIMSLIEKKKTETRVQITTDMKCALINAIALS